MIALAFKSNRRWYNMKFRKTAAAILAFSLAVGTFSCLPADYAESIGIGITAEAASSDFVIEKASDGTEYITGYKGSGGDITLPSGVAVADKAFLGNTKITGVTIPKGYPKNAVIGDYAFCKCPKLKKVVIEDAVEIGEHTFSSCANLETVELNGGVMNNIGSNAFSFDHNLKSVYIGGPSEQTFTICSGAFANCLSLTSINIPDSCKVIEGAAFSNCVSLEEISIPAGTKFGTGTNHFGYINCYYSMNDNDTTKFFADGKKKEYVIKYTYKNNKYAYEYPYLAGKKLTMTVTKGSDAEKYAIENKIAYKYASDETKPASDSSAKKASADKLPAPDGIKASVSTDKITLKWDKVDGADAYSVYMLNAKTGKYEKYKTVKSEKCTVSGLSKNTKYKFKIVALDSVNGKYKTGETSKAVSATTKK